MLVKELIAKRTQYPLGHEIGDAWIDELLLTYPHSASIVVPYKFSHMYGAENRIKMRFIFESYYISALFGLSNPMIGTGVDLMLVHLTKQPQSEIRVGNYAKNLYLGNSYRMGLAFGDMHPLDIYPEAFNMYCQQIENYLSQGDEPIEGDSYWFNKIPYEDMDLTDISPLPYSKSVYEIKDLLSKEEIHPLCSMAEVFRPASVHERAKVISARNFNYPLQCANIEDGWRSDTVLKQGDIIIKSGMLEAIYLVLETPAESIYAGANDLVIRARSIEMSAYLMLYMQSNVGKVVMNSLAQGAVLAHITVRELRNLQIIEPKKPLNHYYDIYLLQSSKTNDIVLYNEWLKKSDQTKAKDSIEDILNIELIENIQFFKGEALAEFVKQDFAELNSCFRAKAYKATLIMCGSILEAVLIDWASEYDHKDYFFEDLQVPDWRSGGTRTKKAELYDFIDKIKEIKRPQWMEQSRNAHEIRKKRNLVHARLCMNSDEISEDVCLQVISYLKDILTTRGIIMS